MKKLFLTLVCFINIANAEIIVGTSGDFLGDYLARSLMPNSVVVSKPGGDGIVLYSALKNKQIDFAVSSTAIFMVAPNANPKYLINPLEEFDTATVLAKTPMILTSAKLKSITEVTHAKRPIFVGGFGEISTCKVISMLLAEKFNVEIVYIPYKTSSQLAVDITSGVVDTSCQLADVMDTYVKTGKWNALANLGTEDIGLPTIQNFPKFDVNFYLLSRHNDPRIAELMVEVSKNKEAITNKYYKVILPSKDQTNTLIKTDHAFWAQVVPKIKD